MSEPVGSGAGPTDLARWVEGYERAWRTAGTETLQELFAAGACYSPAPFDPPVVGLGAIAVFWEAEREGPAEEFTLVWEPVAVDGATAVARVEVRYGEPVSRLYRDLWIVTFDGNGRCVAFEEWPFWPGQARGADVAA